MSRTCKLFCALFASLSLAGAASTSPALASHGQATYFEGSTLLLNPATRPHALAQLQSLGVKALRVELYWYNVAPSPTSATKPKVDATNPASYNWGQYDPLLAEAQKLHWQVLLTVTSPVPRWATSNAQGSLPHAPGRPRLSGIHDRGGAPLWLGGLGVLDLERAQPPGVSPAAVELQRHARLAPHLPWPLPGRLRGAPGRGEAHPRVLFGETAPTGSDTVNVHREGSRALLHSVAPLAFLRGALCLNTHYAKSGSCSALSASGYAHHAYTNAAGPSYIPPERDNVTIGVLSRLGRALDLAARAHAITAHLPIYLTEFGVQSKPNKYLGVSVAQQAQSDAVAERMAWANPRVAAFSQYLLKDDPLGGAPGASVGGGTIGFQTGLEYLNGRPKPLYFGFPVPLVVSKRGHGFSLWGLVRPATGSTKVTVLVQRKGAKHYSKLKTVSTNSQGYWGFSSSTQGTHWRVRWKSPAGAKYEGPAIGGLLSAAAASAEPS